MKTLIGITGTTSVGKSAVAVELAQILNTEIVSADSMQIYRGMDIGTAKIRDEEKCGIKHHMIDIVNPNQNYSSYLYQQDASKVIENIKNVPIVAGGTGFYFDSLLYPPEFGNADITRRKELNLIYKNEGIVELQAMLKSLDNKTYETIDICNPKRVIRAIEIAENGKAKSQGIARSVMPQYNLFLFVLERDRESLYKQIDLRVDNMVKQGLVEEAETLVKKYGQLDTSAFSAIGYKESMEYLRGTITLPQAIDKIKLNTRHYAKRQVTYFKKMPVTEHINVEGLSVNDIAKHIYRTVLSIT